MSLPPPHTHTLSQAEADSVTLVQAVFLLKSCTSASSWPGTAILRPQRLACEGRKEKAARVNGYDVI